MYYKCLKVDYTVAISSSDSFYAVLCFFPRFVFGWIHCWWEVWGAIASEIWLWLCLCVLVRHPWFGCMKSVLHSHGWAFTSTLSPVTSTFLTHYTTWSLRVVHSPKNLALCWWYRCTLLLHITACQKLARCSYFTWVSSKPSASSGITTALHRKDAHLGTLEGVPVHSWCT